mmetsp:Transcript_12255/g.26434  ORF Transcript_12255/g.26434 Transcript_12255/m.26434 type:complete len:185 (+) Transcript_12255:88-642(+)
MEAAMAELNSHLLSYQRRAAEAYKPQISKRVLRQAAYQVINKLVRVHLLAKDGKPLSPCEASYISLNNLKMCPATDKVALDKYLQDHAGLEAGLEALASTFEDLAYVLHLPPDLLFTPDPDRSAMQYLRSCLDEECPADTFPMREEFDTVLDSLQELSEKLGEPLFVFTKALPKKTAGVPLPTA